MAKCKDVKKKKIRSDGLMIIIYVHEFMRFKPSGNDTRRRDERDFVHYIVKHKN